MNTNGRTHYSECWREHLDCAVERIENLAELHRLQLAAISVLALCNTRETAKLQRIDRNNPYWTPTLEDVYKAVDREMAERERADAAEIKHIAWG